MALSLLTPATLAAAAAVAAIAFAPAADADTYGSTSIKSSPGTAAPPANSPHIPWNNAPKGWTNEAQWARPGASNPFGDLPKPPVFAMD